MTKICVVVLGMHRSGTSALARVMNLLGCDLPQGLLEPNANNKKGYWESRAVINLNNEILASAGSQWNEWNEVSSQWLASPKAAEFCKMAIRLLDSEVGDSHIFVLKDPRICRIAPLWFDALEQRGVSPKVLIPIRNPHEVAASITAMKGIQSSIGKLLWLRHVLDAERFSRGRPRHFIDYGQLLNNWISEMRATARALDIVWPRFDHEAATEIDAYLSNDLKHHNESADKFFANPFVAEWVRDTYEVMSRWALTGETAADFPALDRIRIEFDRAGAMFFGAISEGMQAQEQNRRLRKELDAVRGQAEDLGTQFRQAQAAHAQRERELETQLREAQVAHAQREQESEAQHKAALVAYAQGERESEAQLQRQNQEFQAAREGWIQREAEREARLEDMEREKHVAEQSLAGLTQRLAALLREQELERARIETGQRLAAQTDRQKDAELTRMAEKLAQTKKKMENLSGQIERSDRDKSNKLTRMAVELTQAKRNAEDLRRQLERSDEKVDWLRQTLIIMLNRTESFRGRVWGLLPSDWRRAKQMAQLKREGLFDAQDYLSTHPEVAHAGKNPLRHYVRFGFSEPGNSNRKPGK